MWCLPASATNLFSLRKLHSSKRKFCLKINFTVEGKTVYHIFSKIAHTWWVLWQFASLPVPDALLLKLGNFVHKGKCLRSFLGTFRYFYCRVDNMFKFQLSGRLLSFAIQPCFAVVGCSLCFPVLPHLSK